MNSKLEAMCSVHALKLMTNLISGLTNADLFSAIFSMSTSSLTTTCVVWHRPTSYRHKSHHLTFGVQANGRSRDLCQSLLRLLHRYFCALIATARFHWGWASERFYLGIWVESLGFIWDLSSELGGWSGKFESSLLLLLFGESLRVMSCYRSQSTQQF